MLKFACVIAAFAFSAGAYAADVKPCEPDKVATRYPTLAGKTFKVGEDGVSVPFSYRDPKDPDHLIGSDTDYARAVFACLGLNVEFVAGAWSGLLPAVAGGRIDVMWDALYYTPERAKSVDYVFYATASDSTLIHKGNPHHIKSLDTICGLRALSGIGTIEALMLVDISKKCVDTGQAAVNLIPYSDKPTAWMMMETDRADIILTSTPLAAAIAAEKPNALEVAFTFLTDIKVGAAVAKGRTDLEKALVDGIAATQASGQITKIFETYKINPELILAPSIVTQ
jgi:polar amino acid transport system substrate-binding protein